jgi:hypothetical protein
LQGLPDLAAPRGFVKRTMEALEQPAAWGLRPWVKWPLPARIAFLIFALAALAGVFAGLRMVEPRLLAEASLRAAPLAAGVTCFWSVLSALTGALTLAVQHLGMGFMLVCLVAAAGACAVCAGFGTIFVRLAFAGPGKSEL